LKIKNILKEKRTISCEFFPPRDAEGIPAVLRAVERIRGYNPDFVSVTYGAGGSTRSFTEEITTTLKRETDLEVMAHLTCVAQTREEVHQVLERLDEAVTRDFGRALETLSRAGARITDIAFEELAEVPRLNANGGIYAEAYAVHRERLATDADRYDPRVASRIARVKDLSAWEYYDVLQARAALIKDADAVTAPFDAILAPTTAIVAPPIASFDGDDEFYGATNLLMLRNTFCFNFLDRCALSLPMHRPGDAPTGLMVVGETMGDRRLLSIGLAIEAALS